MPLPVPSFVLEVEVKSVLKEVGGSNKYHNWLVGIIKYNNNNNEKQIDSFCIDTFCLVGMVFCCQASIYKYFFYLGQRPLSDRLIPYSVGKKRG